MRTETAQKLLEKHGVAVAATYSAEVYFDADLEVFNQVVQEHDADGPDDVELEEQEPGPAYGACLTFKSRKKKLVVKYAARALSRLVELGARVTGGSHDEG